MKNRVPANGDAVVKDDVRRARTAFLWVGLIAPLAILVAAAAVIAAWLPQLPDPVAIHWSGNGPDGFGPRWTVFLGPSIGAGIVVLFTVMTLFAHRAPPGGAPHAGWSPTARMLGGANLGVALFLGGLSVGMAGAQRGLADAADAPDIVLTTFAGFALLVAGAAVGWFLQPRVERTASPSVGAGTVALAPAERAAWFGTVSMARSGRITLGALLALLAAITALAFALDPAGGWILLVTLLLLLALVAGFSVFRVRVSAEGLGVRSLAGWPSTRIPLRAIEKVQVAVVDPFGEFGGWGWRIGTDGRRGVVMRKGEALQVTHRGKVFVVTVDGAAEAVAVLEGLRSAASAQKRAEGGT